MRKFRNCQLLWTRVFSPLAEYSSLGQIHMARLKEEAGEDEKKKTCYDACLIPLLNVGEPCKLSSLALKLGLVTVVATTITWASAFLSFLAESRRRGIVLFLLRLRVWLSTDPCASPGQTRSSCFDLNVVDSIVADICLLNILGDTPYFFMCLGDSKPR